MKARTGNAAGRRAIRVDTAADIEIFSPTAWWQRWKWDSAREREVITGTPGDVGMHDLRLSGRGVSASRERETELVAPQESGRGAEPVGALGRTARRLKAGLAAALLLTLAAAFAPQDTLAQVPVLTATPGDGQVTLSWTVSSTGVGTKWGYKINGGGFTWAGTPIAIPGSNAGTRSHMVTGLTNGTSYQFIVYLQTETNSAYRQSGQVSATPNPPTAGVTLSPTSLTVNEGSSAAYTVKLDKAPSANVTITVGGASGDVTAAGSPLTFTPGNFGTAQTITVSAALDGDTTDDTATLTHTASSTDTSYGASLDIDDVNVTVRDTTPTFQLLTDPAAVTEGTDISLTVTSDKSISGNWPVRLTLAARSSSTFTAADIAGTLGPREFNANFGVATKTGTVTIPTSTDSATEGAEAYRITLSERTTYVFYAVGTDATADGTLNDAATTGPTITLTAAPGDGQVTLSWTYTNDDGEAFDHWRYAQKKGGGSYSGLGDRIPGGKAIRTHTVTGLENGAAYTFKVTRGVTSPPPVRIQTTAPPYSNEVTATPVGSPAAPTGLSAEAGNRQVKLTWTDPDDDSITRYNMRQKKGAAAWGSWTAISGSGADTTTHTVTGLDNDSEYRFRVRAVNDGGNSAASAVVRATPSASAAVPKPVLSAATAGYGRVTLSWSALSGFTIASWGYEYKPAGGSWSRTRTVTGGSTTSTTVTGLTIGTEYTFRLFAAVSPGVQSVWSDQVKATPTNTVPKPVLTAAGGDASVTLSWSALTGIPITSWGYQYKSTGGWNTTTTVRGGSRTSVRVTGLTKGTEYTFRLFAAVRPGVQSVWSDEVTAKTDPAAPVLTAATSTTNGQIDLTWTHAGGSNELSDADDYVKDAAKFNWWTAQTRLKGASTWTDRGLNQASARQNPGSRNNRLLLNYPDGASVEVRVRATGYRMAGVAGGTGNLQGPWSNIRTVTFKNDDTAALTITGAPVTVAPGATASYTVALTKAYAGTLRITSDTTAAARVSPASLTFTTSNYNTARTVTVTGVANGTAVINHAFRLTGASADAIPDAGTVDVTVADTPGVTVSTAALTVAEGGSKTYTMRLNTPPSSDVTVTVAGASGDVTVTGSSLTFTRTDWNQPQTVTVSAGTDTDTTTDADVTLTHSASGGGYGSVSIASVVVSVAEKDVAPLKPAGLAAAAGNGSVTLSWTDPDNPTITEWEYRQKAGSGAWGEWTDIAGSDASTTSYEVSGLDNGTAYQFEVRAVNGAGNGAGPDAPVTATPTAPVQPTSPAAPPAPATPTPPAAPPTPPAPPAAVGSVTVTPTSLTVEEGGTGSYTVVLDTEPSGAVTVTVGGASGEVTVEPASLTFTGANYNTAQTVTVRAARDEDTTDDTATLTHSASGGGYGSVAIDSVTVTVTDTTPVLTLGQDPAAVTEGEDIRLVVTSDRTLTGTLSVSLTLASRDGGGFDAGDVPGGLGPRLFEAVFGAEASATGTVTIPTAVDEDVEGTEGYRVTLNDAADYAVGSDATAVGVLHDRTPGSVERANRVNAAVLPHVAAAAMSRTLGAVTGRIEASASGKRGGTMRFGALPPAPEEDDWASPRPEEPGPSLSEVLDGASFTLLAGAAGEASAPPLAVWGLGEWVSLSGSERDVSWDGGLWSAQLGADVRVRPDLLAGAALSHARGELDTQTTGGGGRVKGVHETTLTSLNPYAAWLSPDGSNLWASLGYGRGEVRVREKGAPSRSADLTQWSASAGARSILAEDADLIAGGVTRLAVKGEGSAARLRTEADDGLAGLRVDTTRLRLLLEGSHEHALEGGATLTPALEAGVRYDGGDAAEGAGLEAGASVTWHDPAQGLTAELRARLLAAHEADRDEWGVSALVRLDPGADGRGTFLAFGPAHGRAESGLGELFDHRLPADASDTAPEEAGGRLEAEVGHGFGLSRPGPLAVLTPWAGLSLAETGGRTLRLGARYRMGAGISLGLEGTHRPGPAPEDSLMLRGALRW